MPLKLKLRKSAGVPVTAAVHRLLADANRARDARAWTKAAEGFRQALDLDPGLAHIWIQYGHALKEAGDLATAESAYRRAAHLRPRSADAQLHLGHLRKRQGDRPGASRAYLAAARLDPHHPDAVTELHRLSGFSCDVTPEDLLAVLGPLPGTPPDAAGDDRLPATLATAQRSLREIEAQLIADDEVEARHLLSKAAAASALLDEIAEIVTARRTIDEGDGPRLVFDVSDLIAYFRDSRLPTGIQRVQIEIVTQALVGPSAKTIRICCFLPRRDAWLEVPGGAFFVLARLSLSDGDRSAPEWLGALTRLQILLNTAEAMTFPAGACLINLGTSWWMPNYFLAVRQARTSEGAPVRYIPFVHDFIPLRAPHVCAKGLTQDFIGWAIGVFDHADTFLVNSESTKRDLLAAAGTLGRGVAAEKIQVVPLDADARKPAAAPPARKVGLAAWGLNRSPYVLFVSTIEARKNHVLAFEAWLELIRQHGVKAVPKLVCVGKRGWLDEAIHAKLAAHEDLRDRVLMLSGLSDADLALLYRGCLFTLYPSTFEGWGLPVTESLCHGKVPVTSDGSSLPEAGGPFAVYFEAGSATRLTRAVDRLIFDPVYRRGLEAKIAKEFKPRTWAEVAGQVVAAAGTSPEISPAPASAPLAEFGAYHPLGRNTETRIWPGLRSADIYRDAGWWGQDDFGCWTKPEGGRLRFRVRQPHGPLRVYARVVGLPGHSARAFMEVDGVEASNAVELNPGEAKWTAVDLPARNTGEQVHQLILHGDRAEDLAERTGGGDPRIISVGLAGFFLCEADDAAARAAFSEAVALGHLGDLAFNRAP